MVFGWNSYLLKAFILGDFGITDPNISRIPIEYRQRYFHLMFIPFFPIGKMWAIRRDGKLYEPSADLQQILNAHQVKTRNGVWAWSGVLAALLIYFGYNLNEKLEHRRYEKRVAMQKSVVNEFAANKAETRAILDKEKRMLTLSDSFSLLVPKMKSEIDSNNAIKYFLEALATQTDSLGGYTRENTYIVQQKFGKETRDPNLLTPAQKSILENGAVTSDYVDTSSFFYAIRQVKAYKYLFLLSEYNRLDPEVQEGSFNSGYSMNYGQLINLETGELLKSVKFFTTNSDTVSTMSYRTEGDRGRVSRSQWTAQLKADLDQNTINKVEAYLFHMYAERNSRTRRLQTNAAVELERLRSQMQ
jgi:hypothetical protein